MALIDDLRSEAREAPRRPLGLDARRPWPFEAVPADRIALKKLADLAISHVQGPIEIDAPATPSASRNTPLLMLVVTGGSADFRARDDGWRRLQPGEVLLCCNESPLGLSAGPDARLSAVVAPMHLLAPRFAPRERLDGGMLRSLNGSIAHLLADLIVSVSTPGRATPSAGVLVDAVGGLLAATLEESWREAGPLEAERNGRSRMQSIDDYLRRHFADPDLSPGHAAEAIGVSRRYLHRLFTLADRSFRQDLIELRIDCCLTAFADRRQADKTIAEIAFAAGYADISQFNRHFRRLHGDTPTAVRRVLLGRVTETRAEAPRVPRRGIAGAST